ncbi:MAG TPA: chemotaxis protein CheD [bacterium]|nr:chemotaxis protein CheD [bacterium]
MAEALQVGMAELKVLKGPGKLAAHGIGSCVVLALWDPETGLGGLAHSMLPTASAQPDFEETPAKYCDTAVGALLASLAEQGAKSASCRAWLVGGANMFAALPREVPPLPLGERNLLSARESLRSWNVALLAEDCGGDRGRSMELDCSDGSVRVWSAWTAPRRL